MKHSFEIWLESKYNDMILTPNKENLEKIKNVFNESIICHKAGAYRAAIVMGLIGFHTIIRDRVLYYLSYVRDSKCTKFPNIKLDEKELEKEDGWDNYLTKNILYNDEIFKVVFSSKEKYKITWQHYRNMRNEAAHGKSYDIDYFEVESFYSWVRQVFDILYPFSITDIFLSDLDFYFKENYSKSDYYNKLLNNISLINTKDDIKLIINKLFNQYQPNTNYKIANLVIKLFEKNRMSVVEILEGYIGSTDGDSKLKYDFIAYIFDNEPRIFSEFNRNYKSKFFNNSLLSLKQYNDYAKILKDDLIAKKLESIDAKDFDIDYKEKYSNISSFILNEINRRCEEFISTNTSFLDAITNCNKIPLQCISENNMKDIINAFRENYFIKNGNVVGNIFKENKTLLRERFPNLDLSALKLDEEKKNK